MTTELRAMCAELLSALEGEGYAHWSTTPDEDELCLRARALLDQQEAEGPSERIISIAKAVQECAFSHESGVRLIGNVCAEDVADLCNAVLSHCGRPTPQPPVAGEVAAALIELRSTVMGLDQMKMYVAAQRVKRAAALLEANAQ